MSVSSPCENCYGSGRDGKEFCITCNGKGWVTAKPIGMSCEYGGCSRSGCDYKRPEQLQSKGWENEPIHLCRLHAIELKLTNN